MRVSIGRRSLAHFGLLCGALSASAGHAGEYEYGPLDQKADALFSDAVASQKLGDTGRVDSDLDEWFSLKQQQAAAGSDRAAVVVCTIYRTGKTHFFLDNFDLPRFKLPPQRAVRACTALHVTNSGEGSGQ